MREALRVWRGVSGLETNGRDGVEGFAGWVRAVWV